MKHDIVPAVSVRDIEHEYNMSCKKDEEVEDLRELFWGVGGVYNDSYKQLFLTHDIYSDGYENGHLRNEVRAFLRSLFPGYRYILVDVSW